MQERTNAASRNTVVGSFAAYVRAGDASGVAGAPGYDSEWYAC